MRMDWKPRDLARKRPLGTFVGAEKRPGLKRHGDVVAVEESNLYFQVFSWLRQSLIQLHFSQWDSFCILWWWRRVERGSYWARDAYRLSQWSSTLSNGLGACNSAALQTIIPLW